MSRKAVTAVRSEDIPSRDAETNDTNTERGKLGRVCVIRLGLGVLNVTSHGSE